ncbi:hypothetical protein [Methyloversatilis sp.]|uniref:hypothetical protein n=1 Tax=Methyloversatilis sp. TaxID=2569862 RepID=UPI0035AFF014
MTLHTSLLLCATLMAGAQAAHARPDLPEREYRRAGAEKLIRTCTRDGHTLTVLARPGVEVARDERIPAGLPVDAFMDGLASLVTRLAATLTQQELLLPDSEGARRLSDAVDAWMATFNREHGVKLAWAIADFGVSEAPRADCADPAGTVAPMR